LAPLFAGIPEKTATQKWWSSPRSVEFSQELTS
jgi:hypothetical protein